MKNKKEEMSKEIKLNDVAKEAIKQDKNFLIEMKDRDAKAVILNDGVVVVLKKIKDISKRKSEMEITYCFQSIRIDANLIDNEDSDNAKNRDPVQGYP